MKSNFRNPSALVGIALIATIFCSCRGTSRHVADWMPRGEGESQFQVASSANHSQNVDRSAAFSPGDAGQFEVMQTAYQGPEGNVQPSNCPPREELGDESSPPLPYQAYAPWSPPGIEQPWPKDEYLRDGGDRHTPAGVNKDWKVYGMEMEDTVAHYDTVEGRRIVEPSNEVYLYSPRFGAVRQVVGVAAGEQAVSLEGVTKNVALEKPTSSLRIGSTKQNIQLESRVNARPPHAFLMKQGDGAVSTAIGPSGFQDGFKPYENLQIIRMGAYDASEKLLLLQGAQAAAVWTEKQAVQIILDKQAAMELAKDEQIGSLYRVQSEKHPKFQLLKVASTPFAKPGEEVWFTLRFDNTGDQVIGNVTIIDSLSTRLEYVPGSAQCSVKAEISTQVNEGGSVALRCEVTDPLQAGKGGVLRFCCKVR